MSKLIEIAEKEIGQKEIAGAKHNERIVQYSIEVGFPFRDDETPWCSIFLNWVAFKAGYERSKSGTAQSWSKIGKSVTKPEKGDVVLISEKGSIDAISHVGLFYDFSPDPNKILCLGGNQTDMVQVTNYSLKSVVGYRRLTQIEGTKVETAPQESSKTTPKAEEKNNNTPTPLHIARIKLQLGDKNEAVQQLQTALNAAGFNCGKPDGEFGEKTENAVKNLQANAKLRKTGKTNRATRNALAKRLGLETESLLDAIFGDDED